MTRDWKWLHWTQWRIEQKWALRNQQRNYRWASQSLRDGIAYGLLGPSTKEERNGHHSEEVEK